MDNYPNMQKPVVLNVNKGVFITYFVNKKGGMEDTAFLLMKLINLIPFNTRITWERQYPI